MSGTVEQNDAAIETQAQTKAEKKKLKKEGKAKAERTPAEKKKRKKFIRRCVVLGLVALVVGYMVISSIAAGNVKPMVMTTQALRGDVEESLNISGNVQSERYKIYFPPAEGNVAELNVELGDSVSAGDVLLGYDIQESEFGMQKASLQADSASNGYSSSIHQSNEKAQKVTDAEMNLATVEPMIESQKVKINNMETYLEDAKSRERVDLYNEQYKLQKELNSLQEEQSLAALEGDQPGEGVYRSIEKASNEMSRISMELQLLEEDVELTQIERDIIREKNVLTDLEEYKAKQESIRDGSEPQVLNVYEKRRLAAENELSQLQFEEAKKDYEEALKGITADFDGIVTELNISEGGFVAKETAVLKLESSKEVKLTFNVSKYDLEKLKVGQSATVNVSGHYYDGTVSKINRMATISSAGTPVVAAEIHINNPDDNIYLGVEAKAEIHTAAVQDTVMIPIEAVNADKDGDFCFAVENGVVVKKRLETGIASDMYMEVKEGLSENDIVIIDLMSAVEGMEVTPMPNGGMNMGAVTAPAETTAETAAETAETESSAE